MTYILKMRGPKTSALEFGSHVHDVLEASLKGISEPPAHLRRIVQGTLEVFKEILSRDFSVEQDLIFDFEDFSIRGIVDLMSYDPKENKLTIVDHKTCSESWTYDKVRKKYRKRFYGKTKEKEILEDIQLNLYAFLAVLKNLQDIKDLESLKIEMIHNQIIKVKKKDYIKELRHEQMGAVTDFKAVSKIFFSFLDVAKEIVTLYNKLKGTGVEELKDLYKVESVSELANKWQYGAINPFWDHYQGK